MYMCEKPIQITQNAIERNSPRCEMIILWFLQQLPSKFTYDIITKENCLDQMLKNFETYIPININSALYFHFLQKWKWKFEGYFLKGNS